MLMRGARAEGVDPPSARLRRTHPVTKPRDDGWGMDARLGSEIHHHEDTRTMADPMLDPAMMAKLASACSFICGAEDPCTLALKKAAESGDKADIKKAHAQFKKLAPAKRAAAS